MVVLNPDLDIETRKARTLARSVEFSGIGIHTGKEVSMRFRPAEEGAGISFQRVDLPGKPIIPAKLESVCDTTRSTTIGQSGVFVHTVEHVLAAIKAYEIDNLVIEVSDKEPPVGNGSSDIFVDMIEKSGIQEQNQTLPVVIIKEPVYWQRGETYLVALPYSGFRVSYSLHYPDAKALQNQFHSILVTAESFKQEIAPCRTFSRYEEVEYLIDRGLIKGGSLANTLVVKNDVVFSKEGLFFPNEMARHKILDLIGDFSLLNLSVRAHLIGCRTGHEANVAFTKELQNELTREKRPCQTPAP